jgi:WD40 repeat protein/mono/diheme cytochrome c family protein
MPLSFGRRRTKQRPLVPRVKVWVECSGQYAFGFGLSEILQAVEREGSIKQAASILARGGSARASQPAEKPTKFGSASQELLATPPALCEDESVHPPNVPCLLRCRLVAFGCRPRPGILPNCTPIEGFPMTVVRNLVVALALLVLNWPALHAEDPKDPKANEPSPVSYYREVRPLLAQHCQGCHQPAKPQGGLVMTSVADLLKKGESDQTAVVPGKPAESLILEQITAKDGKPPAMPKGKDPLLERDVRLIQMWIAQGAKDDTPASARLRIVDEEHPPTYVLPPVITALDYSPDGSLLAVSGYHEVLLHKADGSELVARLVGLSERIQSIAFSPDGKLLAVAGGSPCRFGEIQIWDVARRKLKQSLSITFDTLYGISWSPDGSKLAFGCADNTLRAIDADSGKQILYQGAHSDWVLGTVFSHDASHLVSVSRDRSMKLTEVATQRFVDNITSITPGALKGGLLAVARHPGKDDLLIGGADGVPKIYQMHRLKKRVIGDDFNLIRRDAFEAMPGRIFAVRYSPDGNYIAAGSSLDGRGEVRVYRSVVSADERLVSLSVLGTAVREGPATLLLIPDVRHNGKLVCKFDDQRGGVYALAYQPDGQHVASGGFDGVVRLNDALTGKLLKEFVPVPLASSVAANGGR